MLFSQVLRLLVFLFQGAGFDAIVKTIQLHTSDLKLVDSEYGFAPKGVSVPQLDGLKKMIVLRHPFARAVAFWRESQGMEFRGAGIFWKTFDEWLSFMESTRSLAYLDADVEGRPSMRMSVIVAHPGRPDGFAVERLRSATDLIALSGISPSEFTILKLEDVRGTMNALGFTTFADVDDPQASELWSVEREARLRSLFSDDYTLGGFGIYSI